MIRGIALQKVDMTDLEYSQYKELIKLHENGESYFEDLFITDDNGIIRIINPKKSIPWAILFFVQNLMINQNLRANDERIDKLEKIIGRYDEENNNR